MNTKKQKIFSMRTAAIMTISVFAVLLMAIPGVLASPGDINVNETGWWREGGTFNASSTPIQHAINNASSGDTINVSAGAYTENNIAVNKQLTLLGAKADVNPRNGARAWDDAGESRVDATTGTVDCFVVTADNVTINGFTIINAYAAIKLSGASNCEAIYNVLYNNKRGVSMTGTGADNNTVEYNSVIYSVINSASGIILFSGAKTDNIIRYNSVNGTYHSGISLGADCTDNIVEGNTVTDCGSVDGQKTYDGSNDPGIDDYPGINLIQGACDNVVRSNTVNDSTYVGISLWDGSTGNLIEGNTVDGVTWYQGIKVNKNCNDTIIRNNTVLNAYDFGIWGAYDNSDNCIISDNIVHDNERYGIVVATSNNSSITNNIVYNTNRRDPGISGGHGIWVYLAPNTTVTNNTLYDNNESGVRIYGDSSAGTVVNYNNIYNNTLYGLRNDASFTVDATNNWWGANDGPSGQGPGSGDNVSANVTYDPWIVIRVNADPTSIAADGSSTSTITSDMTWNSNGVDTSAQGHIPDGTEIIFTTDKGSIGSLTTTKSTTNGKATATLTSSTTSGTATVNASAPPHTDAATNSTTVVFTALPTPPPEEVPAITPMGFLLALVSLFGLAAFAMRRVYKR